MHSRNRIFLFHCKVLSLTCKRLPVGQKFQTLKLNTQDEKTGNYGVRNQLQPAVINYSMQQLAFTKSYRTFYYNDSCPALSNHFLKSFHAEDIRSLNCSAQKIPYHEKRKYQARQV